mgnify:CR=1 FL=1
MIMLAGTIICFTASETLMGMFTENPETVRLGTAALQIISIGFIPSAISVTASGALEGLSKGAQSLVISLLRYIIVIIVESPRPVRAKALALYVAILT